jgi:(2Fe-2S) ferredoxin
MSKCQSTQTTDFALEGRFLGYATDDHGKLKFLRLAATREYQIKLSKHLRFHTLIPGEWIRVMGTSKLNHETGRVKLKAERLILARPLSVVPSEPPKPSKPETILVCQKSDCCKLGGKAVVTALQRAIADQGLAHQVVVKGTGCMKRCKAGPNLVMPDKTRYTKIRAEAIPALIEQHFEPPFEPPAVPQVQPVFSSSPESLSKAS